MGIDSIEPVTPIVKVGDRGSNLQWKRGIIDKIGIDGYTSHITCSPVEPNNGVNPIIHWVSAEKFLKIR